MRTLQFHYNHLLQGDFEIKNLNVLLVFQVNCPGCFSYALPFFNQLYKEFVSDGVSFLALSTAFEDFDKNTLANTKALVEDAVVIGETKKMMIQQGYEKLPYTLDFPIAMDQLEEDPSDMDTVIESICVLNPNYLQWGEAEKEALQKRVKKYISTLDKVALTFTLNQLRGTPSFVLFNKEYEILDEWFGHVPYKSISEKMKQFV
ncbi:hypothetical protein [Dokdonia sp.]|uniref:hypothetical protein n=1 Tax=Dokdonia sp. TaxID=2024995 RepID=UPI003267BB0B